MLKIRREQWDALRGREIDDFAERVVEHLAEAFPRQFERLGKVEAAGLVARGIARAESNGIFLRGPVLGLVELMLEFGEQFERSPEQDVAHGLLQDPELPEEVKVAAMRDALTGRTGGRTVVPVP